MPLKRRLTLNGLYGNISQKRTPHKHLRGNLMSYNDFNLSPLQQTFANQIAFSVKILYVQEMDLNFQTQVTILKARRVILLSYFLHLHPLRLTSTFFLLLLIPHFIFLLFLFILLLFLSSFSFSLHFSIFSRFSLLNLSSLSLFRLFLLPILLISDFSSVLPQPTYMCIQLLSLLCSKSQCLHCACLAPLVRRLNMTFCGDDCAVSKVLKREHSQSQMLCFLRRNIRVCANMCRTTCLSFRQL